MTNFQRNKIIELIEEGILLARDLARGIYPVDMEAEGLMAAFQASREHLEMVENRVCIRA